MSPPLSNLRRRTANGFSLIEMTVVVAIMAFLTVTTLVWLQAERQRTLRGSTASEQATEVATLARALGAYLDDCKTLPQSGAFDVAHADLVAAGLLPPDFALRSVNGTPSFVTSTHQRYQLWANRVAGKCRGVVLVDAQPVLGTLSDEAMRKMGLAADDQGYLDFAALIMRRLKQSNVVPAAVVRTGQVVTDLALSGFALDLSPYLGTAAPTPTLAVFVGFTELSSNPPVKLDVEIDPDAIKDALTGIGNLVGKTCRMRSSDCEEGEDEIWSHTMCESWDSALPSVIGSEKLITTLGSDKVVINREVFAPTSALSGMARESNELTNSFDGGTWAWYPMVGPDNPWLKNERPYIGPSTPFSSQSYAGKRTDQYFVVGAMNKVMGSSVVSNRYGASSTAGTTYSTQRILDSCGGAQELPTPVYRVESGAIQYGYSSGHADQGVGTEFLSVVPPEASGPKMALLWGESLTHDSGVKVGMVCRARAVATGPATVTFQLNSTGFSGKTEFMNPAQSVDLTSACPSSSGFLQWTRGGGPSVTSARPARILEYVLPPSERVSMKYCCK